MADRLQLSVPSPSEGVGQEAESSSFPNPHDERLWDVLLEGPGPGLPAAWLALQCRLHPCVRAAVLHLGPPDEGPFIPAAAWPEGRSPAELLSIASEVLVERKGLVRPAATVDATLVAEPILLGERLHGVVALEFEPRSDAERSAALQSLRMGLGWIEAYAERRERVAEGATREGIESVLSLLATAMEHDRFQGAATAFVTELANELDCDRVSLGFLDRGRLRVHAISHSARFEKRSNLLRAIEAAMQEALDLQSTVVHPQPEGGLPLPGMAHRELAEGFGRPSICSVPLVGAGKPCGVLTLERTEPFSGGTLGLVQVAAALVATPLEALRLEGRFIGRKVLDSAQSVLGDLVGPHHMVLKLAAIASLLLVAFLALAHGQYRVTADAILSPSIRRAAVAPFDSFIAEAPVRAGDVVSEGDLLVALDDRDLQLELGKRESEYAQASKQYRNALAARDAAEAEIFASTVEEYGAELKRIRELLSRADLRAPFDGVVVHGDLSQKLGAPVRRGDVLFEVAPLESYSVEMQVEERDIAAVELGQRGGLVLTALPKERFPFVVDKITPVALAAEGKNTFKVEGRLEGDVAHLRPGVEGVAKIEIDERRLIWIWTHEASNWLRLKAWKYLP